MRYLTNKLTIILAFMVTSTISYSQIKIDSTFSLSGSVDVYFRRNLNTSNAMMDAEGQSTNTTIAPGSSFANLPGFALGMFNLKANYTQANYGFVADLVFGPRGADAVFRSRPGLNIVNQMYGYYQITDKIKATLGNFNTYLGYEVISPVPDYNYSTSYMFSYGPFSHSGFKLDFDLGSGFNLLAALMNPTDFTNFDPIGKFNIGGQLGYTGGKGSIFLNYLGGNDYNQIDLTTSTQMTDKIFLGLNATVASDLFSGVAIYAQIATTDAISFGLRAEHFMDNGIGAIGGDVTKSQSVTDLTFSMNYKVGNLRIIPEVRVDIFSTDDFVVKDYTFNPTMGENIGSSFGKNLSSFVLAAVYAF